MYSEESLINKLRCFFQRHILLLISVFIVAFGVWGSWLSKDIVTFDEEGLFSVEGQGLWYEAWFAIGRWFLVFLKKLLNVYPINPYFSKGLFFIGFPAVSLLWLFLLEQWYGEKRLLSGIVFCLIFIVHPVWATQFSYRIQMEVITVSMLLLVGGVYLVVRWLETNDCILCIVALAVITCCFGSYQSHMFSFVDAIVIWFFIDSMQDKKLDYKKCRRQITRFIVFTIVAFLLWRFIAIHTGYRPDNPYLAEQFRWGKDSVYHCVHTIYKQLKESMFGNGNAYNSLYGSVTVLFMAHLIIRMIKSENNAIWSFLLGVMIVLIPFALIIVTAGNTVIRSQHALVLSCAYMAAYDVKWLLSVVPSGNRKHIKTELHLNEFVAVILSFVMILSETQLTTRLLYTDARVMQEDYRNLVSIYDRAMMLGAERGFAIAFYGSQSNFSDNTLLDCEVIGFSYFEFTGMIEYDPKNDKYLNTRKVVDAMRAYGLDVTIPTTEQIKIGESILSEMNVWPGEGSVKVLKDKRIILVKLSGE